MTKHAERSFGRLVVVALVLSAVMAARPLAAQTVTDPRFVEFSPSPDHNATLPNGGQAVTRYDLGFYYQGAAQPFQTNSLGKPTPGSTGVIRLDLSATLTSWPLPGGMVYAARVSALGPGGSGESAPSNTFNFSTACSYPLSTTSVLLASGAGSGSVTVGTSTGCGWTSIRNASWITITGGSSATGAGSAQFSVTANTGTAPRSGTVTVAGQTVIVTQAGAACTYTLSTTALSLASRASTASLTVTAGIGCSWAAVDSADWLTVTAGITGTANGTVAVSATANPSPAPRIGVLAIAGQTVTVTQAGAPCTYTLSTTALSLASTAGTTSLTVTAGAGCSWTAVDNAGWLTVTAGSTGTANGTVTVWATANPSSAPRVGVLTIAGQSVTVTQARDACTYTLSTTALSLESTAAAASITVTAGTGCSWTAVSSAAWLTVTSGSTGTATGAVTLGATANPESSARGATLTIAGQTVAVTQAEPPLSVTSLTANVPFPSMVGNTITWAATAAGGTGPVTYQFWVHDGATWAVGRAWDVSAHWTWEPARAGTYTVQVWARNAGSTAPHDAWRQASASIAQRSPLTVSSVTPDPASAAAGQPVTWTVQASGGQEPYTYQFWFYDGAQWRMGQDWSTSSTWVWTPPTAGTYSFQVWVRNANSSAHLDASLPFGPFTATHPPVLTATALTPDRPAPAPAGTPVRWTAVARAGIGPYTYQFRISDGTSWILGRDWSTSPTWTWTPAVPGTYEVEVWVRNAGSSAAYDASRIADPYTVGMPTTLTVSGLEPDRAFPVPRRTPVTWTASAVGGTGPYTYKFYVFNGVTWRVGRDWSPTPTWTWIPASARTYSFQVRVRNAGSSASYDAYRSAGPVTIRGATRLTLAAIKMTPGLPLVTGGPALVTATARGGKGPYTYQFWVFDGATWSVGRRRSASNTFSWTPPAPGTYRLRVWVRNAGSTRSWDARRDLAPVTVIP